MFSTFRKGRWLRLLLLFLSASFLCFAGFFAFSVGVGSSMKLESLKGSYSDGGDAVLWIGDGEGYVSGDSRVFSYVYADGLFSCSYPDSVFEIRALYGPAVVVSTDLSYFLRVSV